MKHCRLAVVGLICLLASVIPASAQSDPTHRRIR